MAEFLRTLLVLTALGSALACLLLLVRPLIGSKAISYYLWLLVLLRLCLPVGVTLPLPVSAPTQEEPPRVEEAQPARPEVLPSQPAQPQNPGGQGETVQTQPEPEDRRVRPAVDWRGVFTAPQLWLAVWGAGALFCLGRQVWGYRRFARLVRENREMPGPETLALLARMDRGGQMRLTVCPYVSSPMLLGVVRPTIVLPQRVETDRLEDILAHELTHARRHDLLYKWFAVAVTSLHWFNPLMVVVRRQINRACELSCDEAAVRGLDAAGRRHYGETLLAMAAGQSPRGMGMLAATLSEEKEHLKERLVAVMKPVKKGPATAALTLALVLALTGCAAIFGAEPTPAAPPDSTPEPESLLADPALYDLANGLTAALPADLTEDLLVELPERGEIFLSVYDRRSYEAGNGGGIEGMGWLFSIARYDQIDFEQTLGLDNSGLSFFARGDGWYYACLTPTDVRFYSEEADQTQALEIWEELNRRLPEEALPDFTARNGLESFTREDYFNSDGTLWDGQHVYISYHTSDWSESITLLLSQPAKQGERGIWCVEGSFNNHIGGCATTIPRDTGMTMADYYAQLQKQADRGAQTDLLTPEGAALDWLSQRYDGVTADQLTRLEGEPAWDLWYRELSPIMSEALTVGTLVYADGAYTQVENVTGEPPYYPTLYTRLWVKADAPGTLNGPAVRYNAGEKGSVIFLKQDGLVRVEQDGEVSWYRGAYDYESTPYEVMADLLQAWKEAEAAVAAPVADVYEALDRVYDDRDSLEWFGFLAGPEGGINTAYVSREELPRLQEWLAACTWEEVAERPLRDGDQTDAPAGCGSLWLVGQDHLLLDWNNPYVTYCPEGSSDNAQYWRCTQGYETLYARLAGLWEEQQNMGLPEIFRQWADKMGVQAIVRRFDDARVLAEPEQVAEAIEGMTWVAADPDWTQNDGIVVYGMGDDTSFIFYAENLVRKDKSGAGTLWYQGTGDTDLHELLTDLWEDAGV